MKPNKNPTPAGVGGVAYADAFSPKDSGREHQRKMNEFVKRLHLTIRQARASGGEVRLLYLPLELGSD